MCSSIYCKYILLSTDIVKLSIFRCTTESSVPVVQGSTVSDQDITANQRQRSLMADGHLSNQSIIKGLPLHKSFHLTKLYMIWSAKISLICGKQFK